MTLKVIKTRGDRVTDRPLQQVGGKGLFTKEIEDALLAGDVDIAVHSMKDVPSAVPDELALQDMQPVGNYAYRIRFGDGHDSGIYTLERLRALAEEAAGGAAGAGP